MIYQFKSGSHLKGDAQAVGERLSQLEARGKLTPKDVVRDAHSDRSALHPFFEWDNARAADQYRLVQAGHLIRSLTVLIQDQGEEPKTIRAFVAIEGAEEDRTYVPTLKALSDGEMRKKVLAQAHAELGAVARKYRELKELGEVMSALDRVGALLTQGQPH